jgi:hypothetical protein
MAILKRFDGFDFEHDFFETEEIELKAVSQSMISVLDRDGRLREKGYLL